MLPPQNAQLHTLTGRRVDQPPLRSPHRGLRYELNVELPTLRGVWPLEDGHPRDVRGSIQFLRGRYGIEPDALQLYFYLGAFVGSSIPAEALEQIEDALNAAREAKLSVVLRFAYDHSFLPPRYYTLEDVLTHVRQLGPIVRRQADVVTVWQAGFFGKWGEWGASLVPLSADPEAANALVAALLEYLPEDIGTQVRYHRKSRMLTDPTVLNRVGFHNDYFTLHDDGMDLFRPEEEGWNDYLEASTHNAMDVELPWDSEQGVDDYPWDRAIDPQRAAARLQTLRTDTLGIVHNANVNLRAWKSTTVTASELDAAGLGVARDWFRDRSDVPQTRTWFEYVRDHVGYRLQGQLWWAEQTEHAVEVGLVLVNVGFSAPLRRWRVSFVLIDETDSVIAEQEVDVDPRTWAPGGPAECRPSAPPPQELSASLPLPVGQPSGAWRVGVKLVDPHGPGPLPVPLANAEVVLLGDINVLGEVHD